MSDREPILGFVEKTRSGTKWSIVQNASKNFLSLFFYVILARILDPESFGTFAFIAAYLTIGRVFVEQGLTDTLVQRAGGTIQERNTAFSIVMIAGASLSLVSAIALPYLAIETGYPKLASHLMMTAPLFLFHALGVVSTALLRSELKFRQLAIASVASTSISGIIGLAMASQGYGAISLLAMQLAASIVNTVIVVSAARWYPTGLGVFPIAVDLYRFGAKVLGIGALDFVNRKSDDLIIGAFLGPVALGIYSVAYQILTVVEQLLCQGLDSLALATFSHLRNDRIALRKALYLATELAGMVAIPAFLGLAMVAPEIVQLAFGPKWDASASVLRILCLVGVLHSILHYQSAALKAIGRADVCWRLACLEAICNVTLFFWVVDYGVDAIALAYVIRAYLQAPVQLIASKRILGLEVRAYLGKLIPSVVAGIAMVGADFVVREFGFAASDVFAFLVTSILVGGCIYLLILALVSPNFTQIARSILKGTKGNNAMPLPVAAQLNSNLSITRNV